MWDTVEDLIAGDQTNGQLTAYQTSIDSSSL